jgi:hypothetical protein
VSTGNALGVAREPKPLAQTYDRFLALHGLDPRRSAMTIRRKVITP